eukprot:scaffold56334_cov15-Tisochrysis_lutea.AAC.1
MNKTKSSLSTGLGLRADPLLPCQAVFIQLLARPQVSPSLARLAALSNAHACARPVAGAFGLAAASKKARRGAGNDLPGLRR